MGWLTQFRQQIVDRLQADTYFADVTIIVEDKGAIVAQIESALGTITRLGGKIGACVVVMTPGAKCRNPNVSKPVLDPIVIAIHCEESVEFNRGADGTQKSCSDLAERAATLLHWWTPVGCNSPLVCDSNVLQSVEPAIGDAAYATVLRGTGGLGVTLNQVATPAADPDGGAAPQTVTLSCATPGAAIFYTVDGKFPSPTAGTLYTAPVAIAAACTLKAAAWLAGHLTSEVKQVVFT